MLELRPTCENCNKALPPDSSGARRVSPGARRAPPLWLGAEVEAPERHRSLLLEFLTEEG